MKKVGVIGCGNMGSVIVDMACSVVGGKNVYCYDIDRTKCLKLKKIYKVNILDSNSQLVKVCDVIILAVKPQQIKEVLNEIKNFVDKNKVVVSIAAGVKLKTLSKFLPKTQLVRIMPNLPLKVSTGVSAMCRNKFCSKRNYEFVKKLFSKKGIVVEVKEVLMDLITAVSGSGPAYIFYISEIMQKVAEKLGLHKKILPQVVNYTILGAAKMLVESNITAQQLREAVTSKGGTTEQALKVFFENKLDKIFFNAVKKAFIRARQLSKLV